ncbi:MAG: Eco57I restriction-modification methylase domain-containing protein [Nitrospirae bacterium]|nr:Eco57I restriction-modification methylase domain-containing protein [Nitrospirota bacterium]
MNLDIARVRNLLQEFDFKTIFIEELGWDHYDKKLEISVDGKSFTLSAIAEKKGMAAFLCPSLKNGRIPDYGTRRKIEKLTAKSVHEHIIIYINEDKTTQIWQWVKRESGKPAACREHTYHQNQPGDSLIQKLQNLAVTLDEEEKITIVDVTGRAKSAFDVERVTKKFYDRFKTEHDAFLKFIEGIPDDELHKWYASVMLNRLMFIYFIQKKGFLDSDDNYLRNKLLQSGKQGKDLFYKNILCQLFFEGFAKKETDRSVKMKQLLGEVPYLNGGLFLKHQIEELHGKQIEIADKAFEKLFDFFDQYQWHLDERALRKDDEINPDVLGYIFEKYINQKQMGAYYTKEDITEYISKNTVIPFLFDEAKKKCKIAFEGEQSVWKLLQSEPDRYIYNAVKKGVELEIPENIAVGIKDVSKRTGWNKPAPSEYALPTEIWREVVARRQRYDEVKTRMQKCEIRSINDLITYNLDIRQFAQDVIWNSEGPELLRAFYHAIENVTVLDPTCGSGAFLFAALSILEPLYEGCLDRMQVFLDDLELSKEKHRSDKYGDFKKILARVEEHPNPKYFIYKSIIVNNLYGVDIMEEAIEICKLRLFLKLVAQIDSPERIEPLPDIDFNIRAGNTLVGFATYEELKQTLQSDLISLQSLPAIEEKAQDVDRLFKIFHQQQTALGGEVTPEDKQELRKRLKVLEDELNTYLANEYGVDSRKKTAYEKWLKSHQPFHWFIEFYGILKNGGFDVIIGNPPYLEFREVDYALKNYTCIDSGAIHAMCMERSEHLLHKSGCMSMIVPLSLPSTQRMEVVQKLLEANRSAWYANYAWRPAKLFDTVNRALTIFIVAPSGDGYTFSTNYQKWTSDDRDGLMQRLNYVEVLRKRPACWIPKLGDPIEQHILKKCLAVKTVVKHFTSKSEHRVYYRTDGGLYWKVFTNFAPAFNLNNKKGHSSRETWFTLTKKEHIRPVIAALSSDVFWWWYTVTSNVRHLNPFDVQNFPLPESTLADPVMQAIGERYLKDLNKNSTMLVRQQKQTGTTETQSFKIQKSKPIIDEIDRVLAKHYDFTDEELDFIINYDIKYRMGRESEEEA